MSDSKELGLSSRMAKFNPFKTKSRPDDDDEDQGQAIDSNTVAGGGHSAFLLDITQHQRHVRVSESLRAFLAHEGIVSLHDSEALCALLDRPIVTPPAHVIDRSHPLPEYFISSSHNTYLMAHQLFGTSSAGAYETTLRAGARCIEIDAWDNPDNRHEPKVTHGYTLVSNIPFREVCQTIRDAVDREAAEVVGYSPTPILVSLENHCDRDGQLRLVQIMKEVWEDRLLSLPARDQQAGEPVRLCGLGAKIAVIVEYHLPDEEDNSDSSSSSSSSSDSEEEKQARKEYKAKKRATPPPIIIPELAELGVYGQSVKPRDTSWYTDGKIKDGPPEHHLINISESGLAPHAAEHAAEIAQHNARYLMRIFPKGTRISSRNLSPVPFWAVGAQICALNWQTFSASMQLNDALFAGTAGYVLKPASLRAGGCGIPASGARRKSLSLRVIGATDLPLPPGRETDSLKPYLTCTLVQPGSGTELIKVKRKTAAYHQRKLLNLPFLMALGVGGENSAVTDPIWEETLEWEFDDDELVFLRMFVKSDDSFASNPILAVTAVRVLYLQSGWRFVRMLDLKGHETACSVLVNCEVREL